MMINDNSNERYDYMIKQGENKLRKRPLFFAVLGLLFGVFFGLGGIFSLISLVSYNRYKILGGTSLKWALVLSMLGLILNLAFFLVFSYTLMLYMPETLIA